LFKFALPSASTFSKGNDNKDLRVKNADNAVLQSGKWNRLENGKNGISDRYYQH
jgi:hypothetical protein